MKKVIRRNAITLMDVTTKLTMVAVLPSSSPTNGIRTSGVLDTKESTTPRMKTASISSIKLAPTTIVLSLSYLVRDSIADDTSIAEFERIAPKNKEVSRDRPKTKAERANIIRNDTMTPAVPITMAVHLCSLNDEKSVYRPEWNIITIIANSENVISVAPSSSRLKKRGESRTPPTTSPAIGETFSLLTTSPSALLKKRRKSRAISVSSIGVKPKRPTVDYPSDVLRSSFKTTLPFLNILTVPDDERAKETASVA
jgi:hypothetical protein